MMNKFLLYLSAVAIISISSCKPELTAPTPSKGNIDPTRYVAMGNSITSGYADGALYYDGQDASYVKIIADQLKLVGGGDIKTPYMSKSSNGATPSIQGFSVNIYARLTLKEAIDCKGETTFKPVRLPPTESLNSLRASIYASQGPFNNMGVPGAKCIDMARSGFGNFSNVLSGNYNPFFERMCSNPNSFSVSILSDAVAMNPTFFTAYIGNNDVLEYALGGGTGDVITPINGALNVGFATSYDTIVSQLTRSGAKGAIATIPYVTDIPYFTTIPYNGLSLTASEAQNYNSYYSNINSSIVFHEGSDNLFVIEDLNAPGDVRQIKAGELVLLSTPLDSVKCNKWGSLHALENEYVLTEAEVLNIKNAVDGYNNKIRSVATAKFLALADINALLTTSKKGIVFNGVTVNAEFITGGPFSLDGVHLTPLGNALVANEFIKSINNTYGSTIPLVDVSKYRGVIFP